jgi:ABC-type branched-subunit amino acid transport system substrate-binding protein
MDMSGPVSVVLKPWSRGAAAWFDYVNSHGGVNGHKIKYYQQDTKAQTSLAVASLKQAATQYHALIQIGPDYAPNLQTVLPLLKRYKLPAVVASGTPATQAADATGGAAYVYNPSLITAQYPFVQVSSIKDIVKAPKPTIATMSLANPSGKAWLNSTRKLAKQSGYEVVTSQTSQETATSASSQVSAILAAHPDVVLSFLTDPLFVNFMRGLRSRNRSIPVITDQVTVPDANALHDAHLYGVAYLGVPGSPSLGGHSKGIQTYLSAMKAAGADPGLAQEGAFEAQVVTAALRGCSRPCTRASVAKVMRTLEVDTHGMSRYNVKFTPGQDRLGLAHADVAGYRNGSLVKVAGPLPTTG